MRWLRGSAVDRARYTDMQRTFLRPQRLGGAVGAAMLIAAFWYGPIVLVLLAIAAATMALGMVAHRHSRQPEHVTALTFGAIELNLVVCVLVTGGASSPLLPLVAVPVLAQAVCFRPRVLVAAVATIAGLLTPAVLLAPALPAVPEAPPVLHLVVFAALLLSVALVAATLATADLASRDDAVADPMTGLFNRLTLSTRFTDAQRDAAATGEAIGVVMCDVDHFKRVNDTHGHDRGDQVLVELARRLRTSLRATDVAYRVGGEEFVLLLPGRDVDDAVRVAERVRQAVAASPVAGLPITVSAGVASVRGDTCTLAEVLREADRALYAAKAAGRNRVLTPADVVVAVTAARAAEARAEAGVVRAPADGPGRLLESAG
ncbi:diguanylate cyclase (GGDEF) domain-containing protein [Trujillonella endophytica]|uniref:Diguanylate cyclase (GGDEF) domain-containing protein n=1 Tax=Trujillonella endophytica TaxID=673521 RepID=A0A1H8RPV7_9ACTN|nr:diguanylate cyclase (GGDEF) domain-containing protein [Trujillella endophytica]